MKTEIFGIYSKEYDITFIVKQKWTDDNEPVSFEVKGFYHGEPDEQSNEEFYGKLRAEY